MKLNHVCSLHRLDEAVFNKVFIFRGFLEGAKWSKDSNFLFVVFLALKGEKKGLIQFRFVCYKTDFIDERTKINSIVK